VIDAALWSSFIALFAGALWFAWPRPPRWDPVLFHHAVLANLHGGELETKGADLAAWKARCEMVIPRGPRPPAAGWTGDPALLGADHDPAVRVGAACTWLALGERKPEALAVVARRLADLRLAALGPVHLAIPGLAGGPVNDLAAADALAPLLSGDATPALTMLAAAPGFRDRVRAVILLEASIETDFVAKQLTHEAFDTEIAQSIPWFVFRAGGTPMLGAPPLPPSGRQAFALHDMGELPPGWRDDAHLPQAIAVLLAAIA